MNRVILLLSIICCSYSNPIFSQGTKTVETQIQKGHIQPISALAWHPSGDYFVTGSKDQSILLWDAHTGKQIRSFNYHTGKILNLVFSKDGTELLTSGQDNQIFVINIKTGDIKDSYSYKSKMAYPMSIAFSNHENYIIIGDNRDQLTLYERKNGHTRTFSKGFSAPVHRLSLSPDEKYVLSVSRYDTVHLINLSNQDTTSLAFDKANFYSFSPDGEHIAIGSNKLKAKVFELSTGDLEYSFESESQCDGCKYKLAYSNDGKILATYDQYSGLNLWKMRNGNNINQLKMQEESYSRIQWSNDDEKIILSKSNTQKIISIQSNEVIFKLNNEFTGYATPSLNPEGRLLLSADQYFGACTYSISSGGKNKTYKGFLNRPEAMVKQFDYGSWFSRNILEHINYNPSIDISNDGKYIAQGKTDTSVAVFNLQNGRHLPILKAHHEKVMTVAFHPSKPQLVTGDANGKMIVWDIEKQQVMHEWKAHRGVVFDVSYNSDGSEIISSSWDATIQHWKIDEEPKLLGYIDMKDVSAYTIGFSPGDLYIVVGDVLQNLLVYETDTKKEVRNIIGHQKTVSDFVFTTTASGQLLLATASRDGSVKIWDFNSGTMVGKTYSENKAAVLSIEINQENNHLYFGSADRKIYVYDFKKKKILNSFPAHTSGVNYLRIQGQKLYSKSLDGEVKIWNLYHSQPPTEILTYFQMTAKEWLVSQPEGYFDGSEKAMKQISYVSGMKSLEIGSFFKKYYHPDLYEYLNNGNRFQQDDQGLENMLREGVPQFDLFFQNFQGKLAMAEPDSIYQHNTSTVQIELQFPVNYNNIEDIQVFNNGKLIHQEPFDDPINFRGVGKKRSVPIDLIPEDNNLSFRVTTNAGLTTPEHKLHLYFDTLSGKTELYILSLGINKYENNNYNLKYAKNDSKSFSQAIKEGAENIFYKTYSYQLSDQKVNKVNVLATIQEIKQKIGPEDVFIFYYAGHGMMYKNTDQNANFYLIMSDITNLYGDQSMLEEKGISAEDLLTISKNLPAQKQVFVLDACQSGAALNQLAVRGVEREKTLAQLARNTGTFFLTAAQDIEFANEVGALEHGVFTYAILELLGGKANYNLTDKTISVYELKSYVESRVPELSKIHKGSPQYPTGYSFGNDFPIGVIK